MEAKKSRRLRIHLAQRLHLSMLHVQRKSAERRPCQCKQRIPMFFVRGKPAVDQQNPACKEYELHLGQNERTVSAEKSTHDVYEGMNHAEREFRRDHPSGIRRGIAAISRTAILPPGVLP